MKTENLMLYTKRKTSLIDLQSQISQEREGIGQAFRKDRKTNQINHTAQDVVNHHIM